MFKKLTVRLCSIAALLLVCGLLSLLSGCSLSSHKINWQLYGTVISDGEIQETFEFTIQGNLSSVTPPFSAYDEATLTISMPDTFLYTYGSDITFPSFAWLEFDYPAYSGYGALKKNAYSSTDCAIAFSPDREYVIFDWRDGKRDYYLVASTNPETDPMDVYDFFRLFRETTDLGDSAPVDIPT